MDDFMQQFNLGFKQIENLNEVVWNIEVSKLMLEKLKKTDYTEISRDGRIHLWTAAIKVVDIPDNIVRLKSNSYTKEVEIKHEAIKEEKSSIGLG